MRLGRRRLFGVLFFTLMAMTCAPKEPPLPSPHWVQVRVQLDGRFALLKVQQINNAARHGARFGALAYVKTNSQVEDEVKSLMLAAGITDPTVTFNPSDISTLESGDTLTITVSVPYDHTDIELLGFLLLPVPANLESSVSMAKEGS